MTMKKLKLGVAVLIAAVFTGAALFAQQSTPDQAAPQSRSTQMSSTHMKKMSDESFAKKAAEGGMAEVKLGQLAQEKGTSQAVKDFGQRMVADHNKANDQLKAVASQTNITLPDEPSAKEQKTYDRLKNLSGKAFDQAYARAMVRDHEHDVRAFRREAKHGQNSAIKSFASETLPTLEQHLKMARQMSHEVRGEGANVNASAGSGAGVGAGTGASTQ
ncbi:MAG TPA: DUF4142 domain-containing protein [Terriglobia bacterium]|nr:DUF4142 domain-containing protein [Terriglobia bacterium]